MHPSRTARNSALDRLRVEVGGIGFSCAVDGLLGIPVEVTCGAFSGYHTTDMGQPWCPEGLLVNRMGGACRTFRDDFPYQNIYSGKLGWLACRP